MPLPKSIAQPERPPPGWQITRPKLRAICHKKAGGCTASMLTARGRSSKYSTGSRGAVMQLFSIKRDPNIDDNPAEAIPDVGFVVGSHLAIGYRYECLGRGRAVSKKSVRKESRYESLKTEVQTARAEGRISEHLTNEERANWAYGTTVIENEDVTLEMAIDAAERVTPRD